MSCENDETHNLDNYCSSCATCHDCVEEGDKTIQDQLKGLKEELQKAINERNAAWFQLEENNISHIYINSKVKDSLRDDQGLQFLLKNERFKLLYSRGNSQVWMFDKK